MFPVKRAATRSGVVYTAHHRLVRSQGRDHGHAKVALFFHTIMSSRASILVFQLLKSEAWSGAARHVIQIRWTCGENPKLKAVNPKSANQTEALI